MTDLTKITTPFGLLDPETQEALRAHGGPYECFRSIEGDAAWRDPTNARFETHPALVFRVKPQPPKPREWWAVIDKDGSAVALSDDCPNAISNGHQIIRVGEVLPDE